MSIEKVMLKALALVTLVLSLSAQAIEDTRVDISSGAETGVYGSGIAKTLHSYGTAYPDIEFIHLRGPADKTQIYPLLSSLGNGATNLDYEHPAKARQALLEAQAQRIHLLLKERLPSATLFKTASGSSITKPYVCVVTLDVDQFSSDPAAATRFFSDALSTNPDAHIDNETFLYFAVDHEVFHCLDAYINGPTHPLTESEVSACYHEFRIEQRADLYAALVRRARSHTSDRFLKNLAMFRTLALVDWDLPHYTTPVLREALEVERTEIFSMDLRALVRYAMQRADQLVMSEERWWNFVAAAVEVSLAQGRGEGAFSPMFQELVSADRFADTIQVARLVAQVREAKRHLALTQLSKN